MGVVILGLDAMTWEVIETLAATGDLPTFAELRRRGASGALESTMPPMTPSAWPSMLTGKNPGQHGVWGFWQRAAGPDPWAFSIVTHFDYEAMPLWRILERFGRRGAFFNVPCAFPLDPQFTGGVLTSGFLTPSIDRPFAYPPAFGQRLLARHPGFEFKLTRVLSAGQSLAERAAELVRIKMDVILELRRDEPWDVLFAVIDEPDSVQHALWAKIVRRAPEAVGFFRALDAQLARLVEDVEHTRDTLLIVSDHGFRSVDRLFCVNEALERAGYLRFRRARWPVALRSTAVDLARRLPLAASLIERYRRHVPGDRIQWVRPQSLTDIYRSLRAVTLQSGSASGIHLERDDPELARQLHADLADIAARVAEVEVLRSSDLYHGPHAGALPAVVVSSSGRTALTSQRQGTLTRSLPLLGEHQTDGIVMATGPGIRPQPGLRMHIYDVLPTVLCLLGLPVPSDIDGRPATALLTDAGNWEMYDVKSGARYRPGEAGATGVRDRLARLGLGPREPAPPP